MKLLVDTNVVLDVLLAREPFRQNGLKIFAAAETGEMEGWLCATTVTTIHYLAERSVGKEKARGHLENLLRLFHVAPVNGSVLHRALENGFGDYEDGVLYEAAKEAGVDGVVTRNIKDFKESGLPVYLPEAVVAQLEE